MRTIQILAVAASLALTPLLATADVTGLQVRKMPVVIDDMPYVVHDFLIDFEGHLAGQQLIIELSQGQIFQHVLGTDQPLQSALINFFPELEFDSFVTSGGFNTETSDPFFVIGSAADIRSGARPLKFDEVGVDIAWIHQAGVDVQMGKEYPVARVTLTPDARGELWFWGLTSGAGSGPALLVNRMIVPVPEPSTFCLAGSIILVGLVNGVKRWSKNFPKVRRGI